MWKSVVLRMKIADDNDATVIQSYELRSEMIAAVIVIVVRV